MVMVSESQAINLHNAPLQFFQLPAMSVAEKLALKKKLKVRLAQVRAATESIEAERERGSGQVFPPILEGGHLRILGNNYSGGVTRSAHSSAFDQQLSLNRESGPTITSSEEKITLEMNKLHKTTDNRSGHREMYVADKSEMESVLKGGTKRGPLRRLDGQKGKKQRIDSGVMQQCGAILKKLMTHPAGWVFGQPVDPVKLKIPDYFSIISEPMDLGTIRSKLEKKLYLDTQEFVADVRLTFSNAMRYNPPGNYVHVTAKELNNIFDSRWKSLEEKWSGESSKVEQQSISKERLKKTNNMRQGCQKTTTSRLNSLPRMSVTSSHKQKLIKDLMDISREKMSPHLLDLFRRFGLIGQNEERIKVDIDAFDEERARELQRVVRSYLDARSMKSAVTENTCGRDSLQKDLHKGTGKSNRHAYGSVNAKPFTSPVACTNGSCGSMNSRCSRHNDFTQASSDVDSERSSGRNNHACCGVIFKTDPLANDTTGGRRSKSDPDSDGAVSAVDEENVQPNSRPVTPATTAASGEGWEDTIYDGQLSPNKALRAAMLKTRFADTILKAQQKTLLSNGEKGDPVKMQQEKERLERKQREEKARIEAQIRAAEAASRMKEEAELKMQREREREAARIALQKMEKTVEIDENMEILKDLEMLGGYSRPDHFLNSEPLKCGSAGVGVVLGAFEGGRHGNPLEQLGLFMKDEYMEEEEVAGWNGDVEEGEIAS